MSDQYYFISYSVERSGDKTRFYNECIEIHPFEWQLDAQKYMDPKPKWEGAYIPPSEQYTLLFYNKITEAEYKQGQKIEW